MLNDESTNSRADAPSVSAPNVTRLYNKYGPIDRRKLLAAATTGIVGTNSRRTLRKRHRLVFTLDG